MELRHHIKIYRSFKKEEFQEYFNDIGTKVTDSQYIGDGWRIELGEEEMSSLGSFNLSQIRIDLWLSEEIEKDFLNSMKTRFLRGGG